MCDRPFRPRLAGLAARGIVVLLLVLGTLAQPAMAADPESAVPKVEDGNAAPQDVPQLLEIEGKFKTVAENAIKCVVGIQIGQSRGSGVLVSEDGLILTAGHVAQKPGQKAVFTTHDGKVYNGVSLGVFSSADAGMMKITDEGKWPFVKPAAKDSINVGDWCVAIGHPLGYMPGRPPVVRIGRILRLEERAVQTDCPLISGDSGGPLFNLDGELIGINSRIGGPMDRNYHVPIDVYLDSWEDLKKGVAWADKMPQRDTEQVKAAFREVVAKAAKCVVRVRCDKKDVALGTIVGPDGWILTKASELKGRVVVQLADGRELEARTVGVVGQFDLAMLKIDAVDLPNIEWGLTDPKVGQWVAVPGLDKDPLAIGVISTPRRAIPAARGLLGVTIGDTPNGVTVISVIPKGPADQAGLKKDDIITHINGKPVKDQQSLTDNTKNLKPGITVKLTVKRGEEVLEKSVTLGKLVTPSTQQRDMLNAMGVGMSRRHDDFPVVLQHDSVLRPVDCGSPLVTLDGKTVGVNIARGGRTETYCVPTNALIMLMYDLMSGRKRPQEAVKPEEEKKPAAEAKKDEPAPEAKPNPEADPKAKEKPKSTHEPKAEPKPEEKAEPTPETTPAPDAKPAPEAEAKPETKPEPKPEVEPKSEERSEPKPEATPEEKPEPKPEPKTETQPESKPKEEPAPKPEPQPEPEPETQPETAPDSRPVPEPEATPEPPEKTDSENGTADRDDFASDKKAETEARSPQPTPVGKPVAI